MRMITLALIVPLSMASVPVSAQDRLGGIGARMDDTFRTWHLTSKDGQSQSSWSEMAPGLIDVSLWGHATPDSTTSIKEAFLLDFGLVITGGTLQATDPTLQYLENGYDGGWLALTPENLTIEIVSASVIGTELTLKGSFTAMAQYSDTIMEQAVDPTRTLVLEGSFEAVLQQ